MIYLKNHNFKINKIYMKKTLQSIILIFVFLSLSWIVSNVNWSWFSNDPRAQMPYDNAEGLIQWVELVKWSINDIDTTWTATDKIQEIIIFLLWFITLIAVIYIIYAWFRILTSSGEDEVIKNSKKTIIYVIVWILVIWFAWTIANFAVTIWTSGV